MYSRRVGIGMNPNSLSDRFGLEKFGADFSARLRSEGQTFADAGLSGFLFWWYWLRRLKEQFPGMDPWTRRAFLYATYRLAKEERLFFLSAIVDRNPLESLIIQHAKSFT